MDFTNFYNIKTENVGGWTPAPGAQLTAMQTVNPVMHLAARAGIKMFICLITPKGMVLVKFHILFIEL